MPGYDRTGPRGQGAMTGRGLGYCSPRRGLRGSRRAGYGAYGPGLGRGFRGYGYGDAYGYRPNISVEDERELLKEEIENLRIRLEELQDNQED